MSDAANRASASTPFDSDDEKATNRAADGPLSNVEASDESNPAHANGVTADQPGAGEPGTSGDQPDVELPATDPDVAEPDVETRTTTEPAETDAEVPRPAGTEDKSPEVADVDTADTQAVIPETTDTAPPDVDTADTADIPETTDAAPPDADTADTQAAIPETTEAAAPDADTADTQAVIPETIDAAPPDANTADMADTQAVIPETIEAAAPPGAEPKVATAPAPAAATGAAAEQPHEGFTLARVLAGVGRTLIGSGLIILLFVGYQLWGTNIQESRSQDKLRSSFNSTLDKIGHVDPAILKQLQEPTTTVPAGQPSTAAPPVTIPNAVIDLVSPKAGQAMGVIRIPKIKVERQVVEGVEVDDLRKGPGHYPDTPLPGQVGNAVIAGHRTTYGAPFNRIDELAPGDEIDIQTVQGMAVYKVDAAPQVISPTQVEVLRDFGDSRLTLTSCHPKLSAAQRLVVTAQLVSAPFPALPATSDSTVQAVVASTTTMAEAVENTIDPTATTASPTTTAPRPTTTVAPTTTPDSPTLTPTTHAPAHQANLQQGLGGDRSSLPGAVGWGLITALVGTGAWLLSRLWDRRRGRRSRLRHAAVYAVTSPLFFLLLFLFFENVDRLLPAY